MASRLFIKAPEGFTLQEIRDELATAADWLNAERIRLEIAGFATFFVGPILVSQISREKSFLVSYSEHDMFAREEIEAVFKRLAESRRRNLWWYPRRDPYLV